MIFTTYSIIYFLKIDHTFVTNVRVARPHKR